MIKTQPATFQPGGQSGRVLFKRVLAPVDFSRHSLAALQYARDLISAGGASLVALHVVEPLYGEMFMETTSIQRERRQQAEDELRALIRRELPPPLRAKAVVRPGHSVDVITAFARESLTDLIVIATHGRTGLKRIFMGSVAERVLRHAPCSVLVVRGSRISRKAPFSSLGGRILLATDFSRDSMKAIRFVQTFAAGRDAEVTLTHVVAGYPIDAVLGKEVIRRASAHHIERAQEQLEKLSHSIGPRVQPKCIVRLGRPVAEITRQAKTMQASLIVLGAHGNTGLKRLYLGSVAEGVVRHAHCPVLIVREPRTTR